MPKARGQVTVESAEFQARVRRAAWLCGLAPAELAAAGADGSSPDAFDPGRLRALLVSPCCRAELEWEAEVTRCTACSNTYAVTEGIPVLRGDDAATPDEHKRQQADFFDAADEEFEISRPHGTPWLYRWLLAEKFRRSLDELDALPERPTAVAVCGGSGMDAEFLARAGAAVVSVDISLGAARRARKRAARYGLEVLPVVADVENLPFRDRSIDLVYVHDGLHHLESFEPGLHEMLRTSRAGVSINEPARAWATLLAVHAGLSEHVEEAGNFIARIEPERLSAEVSAAGFDIVKTERYAMVYRHEPGRAARVLSQPGLRTLVRGALQLFDAVAPNAGNKLALQAVLPAREVEEPLTE